MKGMILREACKIDHLPARLIGTTQNFRPSIDEGWLCFNDVDDETPGSWLVREGNVQIIKDDPGKCLKFKKKRFAPMKIDKALDEMHDHLRDKILKEDDMARSIHGDADLMEVENVTKADVKFIPTITLNAETLREDDDICGATVEMWRCYFGDGGVSLNEVVETLRDRVKHPERNSFVIWLDKKYFNNQTPTFIGANQSVSRRCNWMLANLDKAGGKPKEIFVKAVPVSGATGIYMSTRDDDTIYFEWRINEDSSAESYVFYKSQIPALIEALKDMQDG